MTRFPIENAKIWLVPPWLLAFSWLTTAATTQPGAGDASLAGFCEAGGLKVYEGCVLVEL